MKHAQSLSECLTRSFYFHKHKNKQFYHVRMCSNFIWQLRLWFGYVVTLLATLPVGYDCELSTVKKNGNAFLLWHERPLSKCFFKSMDFYTLHVEFRPTEQSSQSARLTPNTFLNANVSAASREIHKKYFLLIFRLPAELKISKLSLCSIFQNSFP